MLQETNSIRYLHGLLKHLNENHSDIFSVYTNTRMRSYKTEGDNVIVETEGYLPPNPKIDPNAKGHEIRATNLIMACNIPINSLDLIPKNAYYRYETPKFQ